MRILFLEIPLCICGLCFRRFGDLIPYTVYEKWLLDSSVSVENVIETVRISETSTTQSKSLSPRNGNHIITTFSITGLISWTFESRMYLLKWSSNYQNIFFQTETYIVSSVTENIWRESEHEGGRWASQVARIGEMRNAYEIVVGKPKSKSPPDDLCVDGRIILKLI
jgi:hypothetical protein